MKCLIFILFIITCILAIKHNEQKKHDKALLIEALEEAQINKNYAIEEELAMLEESSRKRQTIAYELEKELETCTNQKRKQVILSRLITLDKQSFNDRKKINKLKEELE